MESVVGASQIIKATHPDKQRGDLNVLACEVRGCGKAVEAMQGATSTRSPAR